MIDDQLKTMELIEKIEAHLPIPARPTSELIRAMKANKIHIKKEQELLIDKVFYTGDEGGIVCSISMPKESEQAVVTSITQLRILFTHRLAKEIIRYQKQRVKKLKRGF